MEEKNKIDLIDEKSEQVREILGKTPAWMVRWGTSVVFAVVTVLVALSYVVHYPDVIRSQITILTRNPPLQVVARVDGRLREIFVKENDLVEANTTLGIIENTASRPDVFFLKERLGKITVDSVDEVSFNEKLVLGEIQEPYNLFVKSCNELRLFRQLQAEQVQIQATRKRLNENRNLTAKLEKQLALFEQERRLVEHDFNRNERLFSEKVIAEKDFEERQKEYLQAKRNVEALDAEISKIKLVTFDLEQTLQTLSIARIEKDDRFVKAFYDSRKILEQAIAQWEEKYLLVATTGGRVSFFDFWSEGQFVKYQDEIFTIVPDRDSAIIGRLMLPVLNSGKVAVGQAVNIKLDNYPYYEFGMLKGEVVGISLVPRRDTYVIEVKLLNGLTTTFHKTLDFKQEMKGHAEVITEDITLLERIFYQLRKMFVQ